MLDNDLLTRERSSFAEKCHYVLQSLRPKQWPKNLIAYAPLLFSEKAHEIHLFYAATLCVVSLCLISAGIYIFNDVLDAEADRAHPIKRLRPIASGKLSAQAALCIGALVIALGLLISFVVRPTLALVCIFFFFLNMFYATVLKHHAILDVFGIASSFVLRAVAGAIAIKVPASGWFLLCTSLGALFLAIEKRRHELNLLGDNSHAHRKSLNTYSAALLDRMEGLALPGLLVSYAFYSFMSLHGQWMMATVPFVLYGLMRYQQLSEEQKLTGAPEDVFWRDRPIQVTIVCWLITCMLVVYGAPSLLVPLSNTLDSFRLFK